jgi:CRISPR-associated protein Cmr6
MPTLMPSDTAAALGPNAGKCDIRSLLLDRFVDPTAEKDARKQVFTRAFSKQPVRMKADMWSPFLISGLGLKNDDLLFGKLQARLMVNMAGGVMENAGLCLDRFGVPYIPGSAVKGCARRAAILELLERPSDQKAAILVSIALVFGWSDLEWRSKADLRPRRNETAEDFQRRWETERSDFAYACGDNEWPTLSETVKAALAQRIGIEAQRDRNGRIELPNFAGSVSFLPAYPVQSPNPDLELDVVTCHHREYYEGKLPVATDTEEPNPVVFPAVAPGHVFVFAVVPLRGCDAELLKQARTWLKTGLETFGLGAKTNAGYGWFDASDAVQTTVRTTLEEKTRREREAREREQEEQKRKAEEAERLRQKQDRQAALANLTGDERADKEIELLTDQQFDAKVRAFCKDTKKGGPTEEQKKAIVRALRGPRLAYWQAFKTKATKGELATVDQAIRQLSKQMNLGKMP